MTPTKYRFTIMFHYATKEPSTVEIEHYKADWAIKIACDSLPEDRSITMIEIIDEVEI
jgi:hypothetical protein